MSTKFIYVSLLILLASCSNNSSDSAESQGNTTTNEEENSWCIPTEFLAGGVLVFPTINNPEYNTIPEISSLNFLKDNSKVALLKINQQVYVYPHDYTSYYEIINDTFDNLNFAITYCPITETVLCFDRKLSNNETVSLKPSGYLFKENLVPSDANAKYFWSQMLTEGIRTSSKEISLNTINIIETTWLKTKTYFPNALVFNHQNISNSFTDIPLDLSNNFGVITNQVNNKSVHLYSYNNFINDKRLDFISVNRKNTIVVGSKENVFFNAFYIPTNLDFIALNENEFPNILTDNEGNIWDVFGHAVQGPRQGQKLDSPLSYVGVEWAWNEFFDNITIHN
ncbi:MAG: DUF3179 domain-containing (seleno)protein [Flavobacteriaceae bacterium]